MKKLIIILIGLWCQLGAMAQWNTDRILTIGQNALYFEDYVLSIQYFNQVIKIKPYLAEPYFYRAIAKLQLGDYQGADQDCTEALERNPFLPQAYYARGFARRSMNYYPEAIADFSKALEFSPGSLYLLMNRMDARERNKDYEGALEDIEAYRRQSPKTASIYFEKGRIQLAMKDTAGASQSFNTYLKMDSTSSLGWSARAFLKMQQKDTDGALKDYNEAIKRKSTYIGDYINRGILNVEKKYYNRALSDYDAAIKLDNKNALAYYNRGLLRANLGDNNNALSDLKMVVQLDSSNYEALLSKAMLELTLKNYKNAIADYKKIIEKYPYFIPAYFGIAEAQDKMGNQKEAFRYRQMASNIERNKDYINRKEKENLVARNKIAENNQKSSPGNKTGLFNRFVAQNMDEGEIESKYENKLRGTVQDKYTDVVNERNFVLTFYAKADDLRQTNLYHPVVDTYNKKKLLNTILKITNNEIPLTAELIDSHFEAINVISKQLATGAPNADAYFSRALEFALVQDFNSSLEDLNKAIDLRPDFMLAYFCRANIRNKALEFAKTNLDNQTDRKEKFSAEKAGAFDSQARLDLELIVRDYEKVNQLSPDFSFGYFNKANILGSQKEFRKAIANYTKSIEIDRDFAEAYFNRGLTYLFIGEDGAGLADLSKAGELGIYKAYNLIQRFKK